MELTHLISLIGLYLVYYINLHSGDYKLNHDTMLIRTQVVKACVTANISVASFLGFAKRTRLNKKNFKYEDKINQHIERWREFKWI